MVVVSTLVLLVGGVVASAAERSVVEQGQGAPLSATLHALCAAAELISTRAARTPAGTTAKARAITVCALSFGILLIGAAAFEIFPLLSGPATEVRLFLLLLLLHDILNFPYLCSSISSHSHSPPPASASAPAYPFTSASASPYPSFSPDFFLPFSFVGGRGGQYFEHAPTCSPRAYGHGLRVSSHWLSNALFNSPRRLSVLAKTQIFPCQQKDSK
ncbi:hypothetical protein T492DRAFT_214088 [Pavlovales sp. CCMP2436]|nr:hypothetical protein T492DRAFT_214088 [Pavlovales sp. CCMP2436]